MQPSLGLLFQRVKAVFWACPSRLPCPAQAPSVSGTGSGEGHTPTWTRWQALDRRQQVNLLTDRFLFGGEEPRQERSTVFSTGDRTAWHKRRACRLHAEGVLEVEWGASTWPPSSPPDAASGSRLCCSDGVRVPDCSGAGLTQDLGWWRGPD